MNSNAVKNYIEYMDSMAVSAEFHDRLMDRLTVDPAPLRQSRAARRRRYTGFAACAAAVLLCVLLIPGLIDNAGESGAGLPGDALPGGAANEPADPGTVYDQPLYELILNKADSQTAADISIPGHFWHELTEEQMEAVFPDHKSYLPHPVEATAHYKGDGSLFSVDVYEISDGGDFATFNEVYTRTEIRVAPGEIVEDVVYEYETKTSDVYGVSVVAGVFDFKKNDGVALFIASFKMDGIAYQIKLHDDDRDYDKLIPGKGLYRLTVLVNEIIKNGAADLSVLDDPVIPELRDEKLTLDGARSDPDFGSYMPKNIPSGFRFESALRFIDQNTNGLFVYWYKGLDYIDWRVVEPT